MATANLFVMGDGAANATDGPDSDGFYRLKLNQMPADIDTLEIRGVYIKFSDTVGADIIVMDVPDLNVLTVSNKNFCINKIPIPTWGQAGLSNTILYWFEVPIRVKPNFLAYDKFDTLKIRFRKVDGTSLSINSFALWANAKL